MGRYDKIIIKILRGTSDANMPFSDLCFLMKEFGFAERIKGDHHIFTRDDVVEIINIQPIGNKGKPYQVKQIRNLILKYKLNLGENDD